MREDPGLTRRRIRLGAYFCVAVYVLVGVRLVHVSLMAAPQPDVVVQAHDGYNRADIIDRNGELMARDTRVYDVYVRPTMFADPKLRPQERKAHLPVDIRAAAAALAPLIDTDAAALAKRFLTAKEPVLVARLITPERRDRIRNLKLRGIEFAKDSTRSYPSGNMTAQVVGISGYDGHGLSGLERGLDAGIRARAGQSVQTSIDMRVQFVLARELAATKEATGAHAAGAVVMDVRTGEVLGMVSLPDFDPNARDRIVPTSNVMVQSVYELGSVFKLMSFSLGLEDHTFRLDEVLPIGHSYQLAPKAVIHEAESLPATLSARDVLAKSSNIGTAQIALRTPGTRQAQFLAHMGLLAPLKTELYETARPLVPTNWGRVTSATVSYGHGISVSPLSYAAAAASVVNGGRKIVPTFLKHPADGRGEQLISPETSATMRELMRYVVTNGSGKNANIPGYEVGGKTGSAMKVINGRYEPGRLVTSFVAVFPISNPRYLVFVLLDEANPNRGLASLAGNTAAPLAGRVIERIAPILGVPMQVVPAADTAGAKDKS